VSEEEELVRICPVIEALRSRVRLSISVDTQKSTVAEYVLRMGVEIINDIWGLQGDPRMAHVIGEHNGGVVIMHNRREISSDVCMVDDVIKFWEKSLRIAENAKVNMGKIFLDPGVGFGKTWRQNLEVMESLGIFRERFPSFPIYLGVSRKSFIGHLTREQNPLKRDEMSAQIAVSAWSFGAQHFRVHNVALHKLRFQQKAMGTLP
jgi:dihydropteroate synthase